MTRSKRAPLAALLLMGLGALPALAGEGTPEPRQHAREALVATDRAQSEATLREGSVAGFTPFLAEDAVMLAPGTYLLQGKAAITEYLGSRPLETPGGAIWWEPLRWDVSVDAQVGYSTGRLWLRQRIPSGEWLTSHGTYISTWKRDEAGAWRMAAFVRGLLGCDQPGYCGGEPPLADLPPTCRPYHDSGHHGARVEDPAVRAAEVSAADSAFAAYAQQHGTRAAFSAFASEEAYVPSGGGECGREAVDYEGGELEWTPVLSTAASTGDLGWTVGRASSMGLDREGNPRRFYSKYLTVWRRDRDGTLRWVVDGGSSRPGDERL
jgi:ketosteroid isomerase-like protein